MGLHYTTIPFIYIAEFSTYCVTIAVTYYNYMIQLLDYMGAMGMTDIVQRFSRLAGRIHREVASIPTRSSAEVHQLPTFRLQCCSHYNS